MKSYLNGADIREKSANFVQFINQFLNLKDSANKSNKLCPVLRPMRKQIDKIETKAMSLKAATSDNVAPKIVKKRKWRKIDLLQCYEKLKNKENRPKT